MQLSLAAYAKTLSLSKVQDYSTPLQLPRPKPEKRVGLVGPGVGETKPDWTTDEQHKQEEPEIPVWEGRDAIVSEEIRIIGPDGEKVDVMTFRGSFERDLRQFAQKDNQFKQAVEAEDDDSVETILNERFFHKPEMHYSPDKLVLSYGVPAPTSAFAYNALGRKPLPTKDQVISDTVNSIAARFNLRYNDAKWVAAMLQLIADDPAALKRFMADDMTLFASSQFNVLGGLSALAQFTEREAVFAAIRQSTVVRQSQNAV